MKSSTLRRSTDSGPETMTEEHRLRSVGMRYVLTRPEDWDGHTVLVAVHGISRNWREHVAAFAESTVERRAALIVPRFSRSGYRGYQRLETGSRGIGADEALLAVLRHAGRRLGTDIDQSLRLFGFSGGAQFVHRFSLSHPHRVAGQVLSAAGFYTMPDTRRRYPYGLSRGRRLSALPSTGFHTPTLVMVGGRDVERDEDLRTNSRLDREQGRTRLERARRYVFAVRAAAAGSGHPANCSLRILEDCGHLFSECVERGRLVTLATSFLLAQQAVPSATAPISPAESRFR